MLDVSTFFASVALLLIALLIGALGLRQARIEYRRMQGYWPLAKWVAALYLIGRAGIGLLMLAAGVIGLLYSTGNPSVFSPNSPPRIAVSAFILGIAGPSLLAASAWLGLYVAQARRYGLPPAPDA